MIEICDQVTNYWQLFWKQFLVDMYAYEIGVYDVPIQLLLFGVFDRIDKTRV